MSLSLRRVAFNQMTRYCRGNPVQSLSARAAKNDKGKGKEVKEEDEEEEEEEEDEDEEIEEDDMEEEDDDEASQVRCTNCLRPTNSALQAEDTYDEIDPTVITSRRTRGVRVDYTTPEALRKAGITEGDEGEEGEDSFTMEH